MSPILEAATIGTSAVVVLAMLTLLMLLAYARRRAQQFAVYPVYPTQIVTTGPMQLQPPLVYGSRITPSFQTMWVSLLLETCC